MIRASSQWCTVIFCGLAILAAPVRSQPQVESTIELDGEQVRYTVRTFPPGANVVDSSIPLEPTSALNTAKLLELHLSTGAAEEAAMLSNAPRRRFEVLQDYRTSVGDENFRRIYTEYFEPKNRVLAEVTIGNHSLLVWHLRDPNRYAGQFYVRIEDRIFFDDVPSPERARLRRILEAVRSGDLQLPGM